MDERAARRVVLAQAIETADGDRKLLSQSERDRIDAQARQAALGGSDAQRIDARRFLDARAQRVIESVAARHPALAALQHGGPWPQWIAAGLPVGAVVLGVLTDVIANPHRVDLLSLPLLGLLVWNLVMYTALLLGWVAWRPKQTNTNEPRAPIGEGLMRWRRRMSGHARAEITAAFHWRWQGATKPLSLQRFKRTLHLSAAGWAVGVSLSLLARGLVVEYRVGWESTFLNASQVHAILSFLRLPALLVFPFQPFSVEEVAALQFSHGGGAAAGARWVFMYVALLLVVVVIPRVLLAGGAWLQERRLARRLPIDTRDPYFQRLLSLLTAARVHLCLICPRPADRTALMQVLAQEPDAQGALITSPQGDVLRLLDVSGRQAPAPDAVEPIAARLGRWVRAAFADVADDDAGSVDPALATARELGDVVLEVVGTAEDAAAAAALVQWLGKPALALVNAVPDDSATLAACETQARSQPLVRDVLPFDAFARGWIQERVLLEAIGRCLPEDRRRGFERIAAAWEQRNDLRLHQSMCAVAEHLLSAAHQTREVATGALGVKSLVPAERDAQARARQAAMDEMVQRLDVSAGELFSRLRVLHRIEATDAMALQHRLQQNFVVQQPVDLSQAGVAGAASGAAMGASVDLLVGGLTLGAATALGALVGGGAAAVAAAWKNRSTPAGTTVVQLSDDMLQAMTEAALLRYLAVAHYGRHGTGAGDEMPASWTSAVVAAVQADQQRLLPFWATARSEPEPARLVSTLARELEATARKVLETLHPGPRSVPRPG